MIGLKNRIAFAILALVLCSSIIFAVAGMQTAGGLVLVNSYRFEDVIGGAVYSAERGDDYLFVLTPQQGEYVANYLSTYRLPIAYFESDRPVVAGLDSAIKSARGQDGSLVSIRQTDLALWFADNSKSASAIIVGRTDGAEAVSVSSYAVLHKSGLYFTDAARAGVLTARLRAGNKTILIYGSLASELTKSDLSGAEVINTGSRYSDNLEIAKKYVVESRQNQAVFVSGQTFEKTMAMGGSPVVLIGLTEANPATLSWLKANGIKTGKIIAGDGDTTGAQAMLTADGITLFPLIGEGYTGDAQTRPLLVMPLPGPRPLLVIDGSAAPVRYETATQEFMVGAKNSDSYPAFLRIVVTLPDGRSASSTLVRLSPGESASIPVKLDAGAYAAAGRIGSATIFVNYGSSALSTEYIQQLDYSAIPVSGSGWAAGYGSVSNVMQIVLAILLLVMVFIFIRPKAPQTAAAQKNEAAADRPAMSPNKQARASPARKARAKKKARRARK